MYSFDRFNINFNQVVDAYLLAGTTKQTAQ
jgi:hypothetical protein